MKLDWDNLVDVKTSFNALNKTYIVQKDGILRYNLNASGSSYIYLTSSKYPSYVLVAHGSWVCGELNVRNGEILTVSLFSGSPLEEKSFIYFIPYV